LNLLLAEDRLLERTGLLCVGPGIHHAATRTQISQFCRDAGCSISHTTGTDKTVKNDHPKPIVVPIVVRVIVVAGRQPGVVYIVVPRAAAQRQAPMICAC
jgi:hypothetical protein